jgi:hypothetical protein
MPEPAVPPGGPDWPVGKMMETSYRVATASYHHPVSLLEATLAGELSGAGATPGWMTSAGKTLIRHSQPAMQVTWPRRQHPR